MQNSFRSRSLSCCSTFVEKNLSIIQNKIFSSTFSQLLIPFPQNLFGIAKLEFFSPIFFSKFQFFDNST
jgi:hypothetical protein